jgi:hypothetical protein
MINKRTEENIKDLKSFLESWLKFRQLYQGIISKNILTKEDEAAFFETKDLMAQKYSSLRKEMEFKYMPHGRLTDPVSEILSLDSVSCMSEKKSKRIDDNWNDSHIFLNSILERLKNRKRRLEHFSTFGVMAKRMLERIVDLKKADHP